MYPNTYTADRTYYECRDCRHRTTNGTTTTCPDCGGRTRNIAVSRE